MGDCGSETDFYLNRVFIKLGIVFVRQIKMSGKNGSQKGDHRPPSEVSGELWKFAGRLVPLVLGHSLKDLVVILRIHADLRKMIVLIFGALDLGSLNG